jgi:hypothetical protein
VHPVDIEVIITKRAIRLAGNSPAIVGRRSQESSHRIGFWETRQIGSHVRMTTQIRGRVNLFCLLRVLTNSASQRLRVESVFRKQKVIRINPLKHLAILRPEMPVRPCYFQIGKRSCAPLARPQQFLSWPGYVAHLVVLTSRMPRKGITVVPLRGGDRREDLPFERKTPGGCSDSAYRRPTGYRG